jgi:hypothetical protein
MSNGDLEIAWMKEARRVEMNLKSSARFDLPLSADIIYCP